MGGDWSNGSVGTLMPLSGGRAVYSGAEATNPAMTMMKATASQMTSAEMAEISMTAPRDWNHAQGSSPNKYFGSFLQARFSGPFQQPRARLHCNPSGGMLKRKGPPLPATPSPIPAARTARGSQRGYANGKGRRGGWGFRPHRLQHQRTICGSVSCDE